MSKVLKPSRVRVVAETAIASFAGALGVLTIFWHDWIEALTDGIQTTTTAVLSG